MAIYGEAFLLINGWMNCLSLLLAFRLARRRLLPGRCLAASALGALYALWAALGGPWLSGVPALLGCAVMMGMIAGGRKGWRLWPMIFAAGWLLAGGMEFALNKGLSPMAGLWACSLGALALWAVLGRPMLRDGGRLRLHIQLNGRQIALPALRDSGNLLQDPVTGLPVIVTPARTLTGMEWAAEGGLPPGWRLISIKTAAGTSLVPCAHPRQITVQRGRRSWTVDAIVAQGNFDEKFALLPGALFLEEGRMDANL